jgi:hypothetical protein
MQTVGDIQLFAVALSASPAAKLVPLYSSAARRPFCLAQQALLIQMIEGQRRRFFVNQPQAVALWRKDEVARPGAGDEAAINGGSFGVSLPLALSSRY